VAQGEKMQIEARALCRRLVRQYSGESVRSTEVEEEQSEETCRGRAAGHDSGKQFEDIMEKREI